MDEQEKQVERKPLYKVGDSVVISMGRLAGKCGEILEVIGRDMKFQYVVRFDDIGLGHLTMREEKIMLEEK